jgi:uncharacterized membrane protein
MMSTVKHVHGGILWANLHLLFWLSLVPFTTAWMGENHFTSLPLALYGINLLMSAIAYFILQQMILATHGRDSQLAKAVGKDFKGKLSPLFYIIGIVSSFYNVWVAETLYVLVALMWLIPDRRIERTVASNGPD